jgi:hypothetical protein
METIARFYLGYYIQLASFLIGPSLCGQNHPFLPKTIDAQAYYLFYLHGGIVQEMGPYAVSEQFGPYEYFPILAAFEAQGFEVISEPRDKGTVEAGYADKVRQQIDSLLRRDVPAEHIVIVGASLGAYIAVELAQQLKNAAIKYCLIGLCSDYGLQYYHKYKDTLCGDFLSVYEASDQKGSCLSLFGDQSCLRVKEVKTSIGNGHGFLYKAYDEWMNPLLNWIHK